MADTFDVVVVDQFSHVTPYEPATRPFLFAALVETVAKKPENIGGFAHQPRVENVDASYLPPFGTTVLRDRGDGFAEVWKMRWDSSG